jgi:hypothetical protein
MPRPPDATSAFPPGCPPPCLRHGLNGAAEVSPCCLSRYRCDGNPISTVFFLSANGTKFFEFMENAVAGMQQEKRILHRHPAFSDCLFELIL